MLEDPRLVLMLLGMGFVLGCADPASNEPVAHAAPHTANSPSVPPSTGSAGPAPSTSGESSQPSPVTLPEPYDTAQFLLDRTPPANNAAPIYLRGLAKISSDLGGPPIRSFAKSVMELADLDRMRARQLDPSAVEELLRQAQPGLELIDQAQQMPTCIFPTEVTLDADLIHAPAANMLARVMLLQLYHARVQGDVALAEQAVRRALRLSQDLQPRGQLVCQLVSVSMDEKIFDGIRELTIDMPELNVKACDALIQLLSEHQVKSALRELEAVKMEYLLFRTTVEEVASGERSINNVLELLGSPSEMPLTLPVRAQREMETGNRLYRILLQELSLSYRARAISQFAQETEQLQRSSKSAVAVAPPGSQADIPIITLLMIPSLDATKEVFTRSETHLRGTQVLLALRRYEIAHGELPDTLEEAVAETQLGGVPTDPYSGDPLRLYRSGGSLAIYSTGKDLKDDGGAIDWDQGQRPGDYIFRLPPRSR